MTYQTYGGGPCTWLDCLLPGVATVATSEVEGHIHWETMCETHLPLEIQDLQWAAEEQQRTLYYSVFHFYGPWSEIGSAG